MIINVLDLSRKTTARQLSKFFQAHGKVKSCDIVKDQISGESKGFGFIEMINDEEAKSAIEKLNGAIFDGRKIRVKASTANQQNK